VGQGYEPPEHPDVTVNGAGEVADAVAQLLDALEVAH
jgi:adenylylsulfate kinase-like enzyme